MLLSYSKKSLWVLVYLWLSTLLIYAAFSHWAYDDPFITYRYSYNLAHGLGFVYNPGERILSTTTPLFTLLLAPFAYLNMDVPRVAVFFGAFGLALGGLFLWYLAFYCGNPLVGFTGIALYTTFPFLYITLGSEESLYIAFCLGAFVFYSRQRYNWTAIFCALAILVRPDGVLVPIVLIIDYLKQYRHNFPWKATLIFSVMILPWFIFAWFYFGYPLPVTLIAKQHQGSMSALIFPFARGFFYWAGGYANQWQYWVEAALAILGFIYMLWRERQWMLLLSWTILYFLAFSILGVSRYHWYYAPLVPGFVILVGMGVSAISINLNSLKKLSLGNYRSLNKTLTASFFAGIMVLSICQGSSLLKLRRSPDKRITIYRDIGMWLYQNSPSDARVGTLEVGIIGYYSHRTMLDFAGLIQPEVAQQLKPNTTYEDAALWVMDHKKPNYLVLHSGLFPKVEQGYVAQNCHLVKQYLKDAYGYTSDMDIYACQ